MKLVGIKYGLISVDPDKYESIGNICLNFILMSLIVSHSVSNILGSQSLEGLQ